jgi:hypothetical protein
VADPVAAAEPVAVPEGLASAEEDEPEEQAVRAKAPEASAATNAPARTAVRAADGRLVVQVMSVGLLGDCRAGYVKGREGS